VELKLGSYSSQEVETQSRLPSRPYSRIRLRTPIVFITHIRFVGGTGHQQISEVRWLTLADQSGQDAVATMVGLIREGTPVTAILGHRAVKVGVVDANQPYIRAYDERIKLDPGIRGYVAKLGIWNAGITTVWTDDLLTLPQF
jgi:hypothetical protein